MSLDRTERRQRECRILKSQGYTDEELKDMGFDANTIRRSLLSVGGTRGSTATEKRCKVCGLKHYYLNPDRVCMGCVLKEKLHRSGRFTPDDQQEDEPIVDLRLNFDHPDILKPKGLRY